MILNKLKHFSIAVALTVMAIPAVNAQVKTPAPSPNQTLKQAFALSDITIDYSRPSVKGRTVFGDVVPFGKIWRTGANGATKITFGDDVKVEGNAIPAGTYALYTIPAKDSWDILIYKDLALGGNTADYKTENELVRFKVKSKEMHDKVETFSIEVADITATTANIQLNWDKTRIEFNVVADIDAKIMKSIETNVVNDNRQYFQAASYYYDSNKDLAKANEWIDKAIAQNPKGFWMVMLKAKIQLKQNDKKGAVETAQRVIPLAQEAKNDDYVAQAQKLIADNK